MKEIEVKVASTDHTIIQAEQKMAERLLGSMKVIKGLTLYEMDMITGQIRKAKFVDRVMNIGSMSVKNKIQFRAKSMYVQAINVKNAKRKFEKKVKEIINV
jgi:hypothetical protein